MAWMNWPVAAGDNIQLWSLLSQLWYAAAEVAWIIGIEHFPRTTAVEDPEPRPTSYTTSPGYTGIITSFAASGADYILTDTGRAWAADRWFSYSGPDPHSPEFYDVVIEYDELNPWGVVRSEIIASPAGDAVTVKGGPIDDAIVAGQIPSAAALVGKRFCFVRKHTTGHPSLHWHQRWLPWPNAAEYDRGTVQDPTTTAITDVTKDWTVDRFVGKELMLIAGGRLQRITITGNTATTITFATLGTAPDGGLDYAIIDAGEVWAYGRPRPAPWRWYGGYDRPTPPAEADPRFYSHWPDGTLQPTPFAAAQIRLLQTDPVLLTCVPTSVDVFDIDFWTDYDDDCTLEDFPHAPEFYYALRGLQVYFEGACTSFVENIDHSDLYPTTDNTRAVPNFVQATAFKAAGINHYTTTVSTADVSGTPHITFPAITLPAGSIDGEIFPLQVHYAIIDSDDAPADKGYSAGQSMTGGTFGPLMGQLVSTTRIDLRSGSAAEGGTYPPDQLIADEWVGKTLIISLGWSRYRPREFRYFYEKTACIDPGGGGTTFYLSRAASTRYVETSELGNVGDTDTPLFVDGDAARYVGDNWADPTTDDSVDDGIDDDTLSRDRFFTGVAPPEFGTATEGSTTHLRDEPKDWWGGTLRTETGTATGGSTTTLSDTSKSASAYWDGTTGRYLGFVVEVEIDEGDGPVWHRRPITGFTAGTQTLTWAEALPVTAGGKNYRIREPAELNRWKGRTVRLYLPGAAVDRVVTHSDDDTLYFADAGQIVTPGTAYDLLEAQPGEVWQWSASATKWVKPTGADARGAALTPPVTWRTNPNENAPTIVRRFGRLRRGDYIAIEALNQLHDFNNVLTATKRLGGWVPGESSIGTFPENTLREFGIRNTNPLAGDYGTWDDAKADADGWFASPRLGARSNNGSAVPLFRKELFYDVSSRYAEITAAHAYAEVDDEVPTTRIKHATDVYIYTGITPTDDDPVDLSPDPGTGYTWRHYFQSYGYNVFFRKWGKIASEGPTFDSSTYIRIGDTDTNAPGWPATPGEDGSHLWEEIGSWSVVGVPIVVHRWDVAGGRTYVAAPPAPPGSGGLESGEFGIDL